MASKYLKKFDSVIGSRQTDQILKLLSKKKQSGEIRTVDEFVTKLDTLVRELAENELSPSTKLYEAKDDEMAILAGLYMAKQKFGGSIELTGSEEFKRRAIEVLIKHEVPVELNNPAQEAIRRELLGLPPIAAVPDKNAPQAEAPKPSDEATGALIAPIYQTSTYVQEEVGVQQAVAHRVDLVFLDQHARVAGAE